MKEIIRAIKKCYPIYLYAFLIFTLNACSVDAKIENDWELYNLKGKVKSVTEVTYQGAYRFGKIEIAGGRVEANNAIIYFGDGISGINYPFNTKKIYFDERGKITEEQFYNLGGTLSNNITYQYNAAGKLHTMRRGGYRYEYKYDPKGVLLQEIIFFDTTKQYISYVKFDEDNNLFKKIRYNDTGALDAVITYKYYKNRLSSIVDSASAFHINSLTHIRGEQNFYYNDRGDLERYSDYNPSFSKNGIYEYNDYFTIEYKEYDKLGNYLNYGVEVDGNYYFIKRTIQYY
jgi:hypothetical protein